MGYDFNADEIFEIAEQIERNGASLKDSIVFYLGMKEMVPENFGKAKIDAIIKEEMTHIKLLSKELVALKK